MKEPIHILVTCRKPELLPAATLVFKTIRVGFPEAPVILDHNPVAKDCLDSIRIVADDIGATLRPRYIDHDEWIVSLIELNEGPFWICDTDVVFWREFKHGTDGSAIAGVRTPSFYEPWMRTQYRERLHTCLMRVDPVVFRSQAARYRLMFPAEPFPARVDFIRQQWQPERNNGKVTHHFYDTLAMAWHAFGGQEFSPEQIGSFDHLNCATYADLIAPALDFDIQEAHAAIYNNIENARGLWAKQFDWFAAHREKPIP
jgi:hypothetical protein